MEYHRISLFWSVILHMYVYYAADSTKDMQLRDCPSPNLKNTIKEESERIRNEFGMQCSGQFYLVQINWFTYTL